jgi:hypothetical protein
MAIITVYGASDDCIEVDGDFSEEFNYLGNGGGSALLAVSDGTILRIEFGEVWRITPVVRGTAIVEIEQAPEDDEDNYTDRATLIGDIRWVVQGIAWAGKDAG